MSWKEKNVQEILWEYGIIGLVKLYISW